MLCYDNGTGNFVLICTVCSVEQRAAERFWFSTYPAPWASAMEMCMALDSTLVMVENQAKQTELDAFLSRLDS